MNLCSGRKYYHFTFGGLYLGLSIVVYLYLVMHPPINVGKYIEIYTHADMHACTYIHTLSLMIMIVIIFTSPSFTMPWPVSTETSERTSLGGFFKQYVKWQSFLHSHIWQVHSESAWEPKIVPHMGSRWPAISCISFSFCWKVGVCGECVVTLPLTVNEH